MYIIVCVNFINMLQRRDFSYFELCFISQVTGPHVLEALAASGLRSIRYALEIPTLGSVVANDFSEVAYENMCRNIKENGVSHLISPTCREARFVCIVVYYYMYI